MTTSSESDRNNALLFFGVAALVLAAGYGLREPWPADEPRFVLVARQMIESGNFLYPHRGAELYPDKPPLYFWLLAGAYRLVGSWRWSFLLPSLLASLGTLWLTFDLGRRLWSPRTGLWAAVLVGTAFQFVYQAKRAQIDPTLVFFTTLSLYGLCRHLFTGPQWRWYALGCLAAGMGVIAKGVGFLPLLALLPFGLMVRGSWRGLSAPRPGDGWKWAGGAALVLVPVLLWLVPVTLVALAGEDPERMAYLRELLFRQTAQRYVQAWHHTAPAWYFLAVIAFAWLPSSLALPWLARPWAQAWRDRDGRVWLLLAWVGLVLLFFSASPGKRDMYILPALPALALAAAPYMDALVAGRLRWAVLAFVVAAGAVLFGTGLVVLAGEPAFEQRLAQARGLDGEAIAWLAAYLVAGGGVLLGAAALARSRHALAACGIGLAVLWVGYGVVVHPVLDDDSSSRAVMHKARALAGPTATIGLVAWKEQNLLQASGPVTEFGFRNLPERQLADGREWLVHNPQGRLLVSAALRPGCPADAPPRFVGSANRRQWWLVATPAAADCLDPGP